MNGKVDTNIERGPKRNYSPGDSVITMVQRVFANVVRRMQLCLDTGQQRSEPRMTVHSFKNTLFLRHFFNVGT